METSRTRALSYSVAALALVVVAVVSIWRRSEERPGAPSAAEVRGELQDARTRPSLAVPTLRSGAPRRDATLYTTQTGSAGSVAPVATDGTSGPDLRIRAVDAASGAPLALESFYLKLRGPARPIPADREST